MLTPNFVGHKERVKCKKPSIFFLMGPKRFVEELDKRLRTTIKHRSVGREVSYRRLIRMEIYKIEKHIMGEKEYKPFVSQW